MNSIKIIMVKLGDLEKYVEHIIDHMKESGQNNIYFSPLPSSFYINKSEMFDKIGKRWQQPLTNCNWERAWIVKDNDKIVGHLDIRGNDISSSSHRCFLGMGLMSLYRGKGLGTQLMNETIKWCRQQEQIEWIDLGVFHKNYPAIKLYEKIGFQKIGIIIDRFRVEGVSINDIQMTLNVCREDHSSRIKNT